MPLTSAAQANEILNRVAAEVGLSPLPDPYSSDDPSFIKMKYLLNTAGEELVVAREWEALHREHSFTTVADTNEYDLPADFGYMINQTGWEQNNNMPLGGPLSAQDWTYLEGRKLGGSTIYASFRVTEGKFKIYPDPPPEGWVITYEYITKNWVMSADDPPVYKDAVAAGTDIPQFHKTLISRYLKLKYLEATGFDTTKAQDDFAQTFTFLTEKDRPAQVLDAGRTPAYPLISGNNIPYSGFGR
jgi:hypothetical protein